MPLLRSHRGYGTVGSEEPRSCYGPRDILTAVNHECARDRPVVPPHDMSAAELELDLTPDFLATRVVMTERYDRAVAAHARIRTVVMLPVMLDMDCFHERLALEPEFLLEPSPVSIALSLRPRHFRV